MKICFPMISHLIPMPDSQMKQGCLAEQHFVSDRLGWAGSKVLLLLTV